VIKKIKALQLLITNLYSKPNIFLVIKLKRKKLAGHMAHRGTGEALAGKPDVRRLLGRPKHRW
jgi:hypothetical protein